MNQTQKKETRPPFVYVEYYRASDREVSELKRHLLDYEGVKGLGKVARKCSGAVEVGELFTVWVLPVLVSYAGNKILQVVEDRVKEWFKTHGHDDQFITLNLSTQSKRRKIGNGRPRRYPY